VTSLPAAESLRSWVKERLGRPMAEEMAQETLSELSEYDVQTVGDLASYGLNVSMSPPH
jgi:hypothetical protein